MKKEQKNKGEFTVLERERFSLIPHEGRREAKKFKLRNLEIEK